MEPVKIVVFVHGGVVQQVMTCGVPVEVAVIDSDDVVEPDEYAEVEQYPEEDSPNSYTANGYVWVLDGGTPKYNDYALRCFNIARVATMGEK